MSLRVGVCCHVSAGCFFVSIYVDMCHQSFCVSAVRHLKNIQKVKVQKSLKKGCNASPSDSLSILLYPLPLLFLFPFPLFFSFYLSFSLPTCVIKLPTSLMSSAIMIFHSPKCNFFFLPPRSSKKRGPVLKRPYLRNQMSNINKINIKRKNKTQRTCNKKKIAKKKLPHRELNPGLPRDRRGFYQLYYKGK